MQCDGRVNILIHLWVGCNREIDPLSKDKNDSDLMIIFKWIKIILSIILKLDQTYFVANIYTLLYIEVTQQWFVFRKKVF